MNKYFKNMVLCSELDYHCLLCKESFETLPDVEKHIRWEKHRHSIKHQNNAPKYKQFIHKHKGLGGAPQDEAMALGLLIRRSLSFVEPSGRYSHTKVESVVGLPATFLLDSTIGEIYYCEVCNYVVNTEGLQEHIKSSNHKECKANPEKVYNRITLGKREDSKSIKFPNLTVNRLQWHGIHKGNCLLCDDIVDNVHDHISTTKHMVFIIQSPIIENASCYFRKIADNKHYCFGCSEIVSNDFLIKHNCKKEKGRKPTKDEDKRHSESPELLKIIANIKKDTYDINIKEKTATCKLCSASVDATFEAMSKHTLQFHEDTIQYIDPEDHGKRRSELAKYGKENFVKLNKGGSKGYCSLCDIHISAHMKVAIQHVNGLRHRGHLEIKGLVPRKRHTVPGYRTLALQLFLKDMFHAQQLKATCINFSVCVDDLSFMFIKTIDHNNQQKRKCFCCDMVFGWDDLKEHWKTRKHANAFASADVLLVEEEFIRIVRSDLFHCGFCNQVFPYWESMAKHIASWTHGIAKKKSELACTLALQWYTEQETNGAVTFSDDLYLRCMELGIL